ncbi:MAG: right-handed parallel beta-helix repeat-containing protein, partial [Bacteroidota bacterium]
NGANTANGVFIQDNPSATTTYTVTITDQNGCTASDDHTVVVEACCPAKTDPNYLSLDNSVTAGRIITGGAYELWPDKVYVDDNVEVLVSGEGSVLDMTQTDVVFGECAGIRVENGGRLIATNSTLRPCYEENTWRGVTFGIDDAAPDFDRPPSGTFKECTFLNAADGIFVEFLPTTNSAVEVDITNNLFLNNFNGVRIMHGRFAGAISGNTFKIDEGVEDLIYCGQAAPAGGFTGLHFISNTTASNDFIRNPNIISQNDFVKGFRLNYNGDQEFDGIHCFGTRQVNISSNRFTNNDRGIVMVQCAQITVENNDLEVTRRSTSDNATYQITFDANGDFGAMRGLIHNNRLHNSAEIFNSSQIENPDGNFIGTGGIYLTTGGRADVENNEIDGFEIGIMIDKPEDFDGIRSRIVNNKITAHAVGIYQNNLRRSFVTTSAFIGCNEIDMDQDLFQIGNLGLVGYYLGLEGEFGPGLNPNVPRRSIMLAGNCIRNTTSAMMFDHFSSNAPIQNQRLPQPPRLENNYLFNYRDAGTDYRNFNGRIGQSFAFGTNYLPGRNTYISNQGPDAADIVYDLDMPAVIGVFSGALTSDRNDFGLDGPTVGGNYAAFGGLISFTSGTNYPSVTACGNQDADSTINGDFIDYCDDANYTVIQGNPVLSRTEPDAVPTLNPEFEAQLLKAHKDAPRTVFTDVKEAVLVLSEVDAAHLMAFVAAENLLNSQEAAWLAYHRAFNKGEFATARG